MGILGVIAVLVLLFFLLKKVIKSIITAAFIVVALFSIYMVLTNVLYVDLSSIGNIPDKFKKKEVEIQNRIEQEYEYKDMNDISVEVDSDGKKYIKIKKKGE